MLARTTPGHAATNTNLASRCVNSKTQAVKQVAISWYANCDALAGCGESCSNALNSGSSLGKLRT